MTINKLEEELTYVQVTKKLLIKSLETLDNEQKIEETKEKIGILSEHEQELLSDLGLIENDGNY